MTTDVGPDDRSLLHQLALGDGGVRALALRVLLALGLFLLIVAGYVAVRLAPLVLAPNPYADVTSIERDSAYRDPVLMHDAWHGPVAASYERGGFEFQHNQSFCGPTSVADVLHSLGDTRMQEQMLSGTAYHTFLGYLLGGLTLDQEADLMRRQSHRPATILRGLTLDRFRAMMRRVNDPHHRYVANFDRGPLFGRGHGHFSPLLAYLPGRDLVLVGDVNREYRPFFVATRRLWEAVNTIDPDTGKPRGLIAVSVG